MTEQQCKLSQLLREHYGLDRFLPAPVRVPGFHRVDLSRIINVLGLKRGAEIGVAAAEHAQIMLDNIEGCELLCVDHWRTGWWSKLEGRARRRLADYNATILKAPSVEAAGQVENGSLDFVYVDAAHDFDNVMLDLILWSRKVRPGGIVAGHDYDGPHRRGVVAAVNIYTRMHQIGEWFLTDQKREASFFWMKP